jgi:hypothetical protein
MKTIRLVLLLASLAGLASGLRAAESVSVRGILVAASNEPGESDSRLSTYVPNLRRIMHSESFRMLGEDSASLAVPAKGNLSLGGQGVQLSTESADGKTVLLHARWGAAQQDYMIQRSGGTLLLVGPSDKKGNTQAVLLIAR